MLRTYGKKMGIITLLLDVLKGVVMVYIALLYVRYIKTPDVYYLYGMSDLVLFREAYLQVPYIAGVCVVLGHDFPLYFGFKGGKGVATSLGVVLMLDWKVGLILLVVALLIMAITRYVSLGSVIGGAAFIIAEIVKMSQSGEFKRITLVCTIILGGLLIVKHHANINRLIHGTENKLSFSKKGDAK